MDAVKQLPGQCQEPIASREDRQRMHMPNESAYKKWANCNEKQKRQSPRDFHKATPVRFNSPEVTISSKHIKPHYPKLRTALTIDNVI